MRNRFLHVLAHSMNCDPAAVSTSGVSVAGHASRAENRVTAGYLLGEHFIVTCDPAVEAMLSDATSSMAPTLDAWRELAATLGGEFLADGRMQVLPGGLPAVPPVPAGFTRRSLDRDDQADLALIAQLIDDSDADDLDEAEIELDDLDEIIEVLVDDRGEIACYSAARPFDLALDFADIGIMTRPEHRHKGLGSMLVAALCARLRAEGLEPLYRCDEDNTGSILLSAGLGFEIATQLSAFRFPTADQ